jgi:hypothetical protein
MDVGLIPPRRDLADAGRRAHPSREYKQLQFQKQFRLSLLLETTSGGSVFAEALALMLVHPSSKALASVLSDASD